MDSYKANLVLESKVSGAERSAAMMAMIAQAVTHLANVDAKLTAQMVDGARVREQAIRKETQNTIAYQDAHVKAYLKNQQTMARETAKLQAQEAKASGRRSVFGIDTGVDLVNLASGLYTVQTAYRMVAQAASVAMDAIQEAAKWEQYSVAITTMEGSATTAAKSLEDLYQIAKAPGINLEGANKSYLQLRAIGVEGERAKTIIAEFANTVARSGGGGVEFERVNRQLVQMLANGRVLESELKWMKESMPELAKVMQATFGTTSAEGIRKLGIGADEFVAKLTDSFSELDRAHGTLNTEIENLETAWSRAKASFVDKEFWKEFLSNMTATLEKMTEIREEIERAKGKEKTQKSVYSMESVLGWLARAGAYAPNGLEISGELAAGTGAQRTQLQKQDDAIIRAMQSGIGGIPAEYYAQNPLTGYWAAKESEAAAAEKKSTAKPKKAHTPSVSFKTEATTSGAHERKLQDELFKAESARQRKEDDLYWAGVENKKNALAEIAAVGRSAKEQELVEAAEWRVKMETSIGDDNAAYLRLEEAYGKKLADINEKYNKQIAEDEKKAQQERLAAMEQFTSGMGSLAGAMGGLILQMNSDNTEAYAAMVAIQQGFAIAQATMNMYVAMSQALTQPFPANLAAVGEVAAAGGQILSAITAMNVAKVGKGAFDRGGTLGYGEWGIAGERGAEIVEGPARITSRRDTASMLRGGGSTSVAVNVHNYAGASVATKQNSDGSIDLIIDKLEERMAEGVYTGSGKMGTAMSRTFGLKRAGR